MKAIVIGVMPPAQSRARTKPGRFTSGNPSTALGVQLTPTSQLSVHHEARGVGESGVAFGRPGRPSS